MTSSHTTSAATGTLMYLLTPNSSMPAAMPANSENVVAVLATSNASMASEAGRTPKVSRIIEANPLPVTAPMRAVPSCTTASMSAMMGMIHRVP